MGCGEAQLAQNLKDRKIYSFDLVKLNEYITVADIKNVPLEDSSVDICIFCLALMGKNFVDFIKEAKRILKENGLLIVVEINSRIVSQDKFIKIFTNQGFKTSKDKDLNNYFKLLIFKVPANKNEGKNIEIKDGTSILKPCIYKKR
jgi:ribosomal RNA-processing protein 8